MLALLNFLSSFLVQEFNMLDCITAWSWFKTWWIRAETFLKYLSLLGYIYFAAFVQQIGTVILLDGFNFMASNLPTVLTCVAVGSFWIYQVSNRFWAVPPLEPAIPFPLHVTGPEFCHRVLWTFVNSIRNIACFHVEFLNHCYFFGTFMFIQSEQDSGFLTKSLNFIRYATCVIVYGSAFFSFITCQS